MQGLTEVNCNLICLKKLSCLSSLITAQHRFKLVNTSWDLAWVLVVPYAHVQIDKHQSVDGSEAYAHYSGVRSFLKQRPISVLPWSVLTEEQNLEQSYCFIKIVLTPAPLQFLAAAWVTSPPPRRLVNCDLLSVTDFEDPCASLISKRRKKKKPR